MDGGGGDRDMTFLYTHITKKEKNRHKRQTLTLMGEFFVVKMEKGRAWAWLVTLNVSLILELDLYVSEVRSVVSKVDEKKMGNKNVRNIFIL